MTLEFLSYIQVLIITIGLCIAPCHVLGCVVSCIGHCLLHLASLHESCLSRFVWFFCRSLFVVLALVQCLGLSWREVDSYHSVAIDKFIVGFGWLAYHLCGFDSGGIDQFELDDGYST